MGFLAQTVAAFTAAISVNVCAVVDFTNNTTHYNQPTSLKISINDIAHRGTYAGPRHTGSLERAQSTIFLRPDYSKPPEGTGMSKGMMALHVTQSPMQLDYLIMTSKGGAKSEAAASTTVPRLSTKRMATASGV